MKNLYSAIVLFMTSALALAQVDTVDNGKVVYIDSAQNLKLEIPFKGGQVNGTTKGFDLESGSLIIEGKSKDNQKVGVWNYYQYNALGDKLIAQFFTYKSDTLNGPFKKRDDSLLITGSFIRDTLDGQYKEELVSLDDTLNFILTPVDSGQFKMGIKYGLWTFLKNGNLSKVGNYENNQYHLHWKIYDTINPIPQKLMRDIQYFEGVKTGNEIVYFSYKNGKKIEEQETIPWQMGKLSGNYSKKNANDVALESGMYSEDIKIGKWTYHNPLENTTETVTYLNNQFNGPYQMDKAGVAVIKGTYALDKKNKTWSYYSEKGVLTRDEMYENGEKTGEWNFYNSNKVLTHSMVYDANKVVELYRFDKNSDEILKLEFDYSPDNYLKITAGEQFMDSSISVDLIYRPKGDTIDTKNFLTTYLKSGEDTTVFKRHGGYSVTKSGSVEYQGVYSTNIKHGDWSYYYNSRIVWKKVFNNGIMTGEVFVDKSTGAKIEKGEYVLWYGPERPRVEFKIQNGVRDGKSIWYKKNGEELKMEKYKDGMLN